MREVTVGKPKSTAERPVEKRGGYAAGTKLVTELKPPPAGPAPGSKPASDSTVKK
jgi:hypothetical protein